MTSQAAQRREIEAQLRVFLHHDEELISKINLIGAAHFLQIEGVTPAQVTESGFHDLVYMALNENEAPP